MESQEQPYRSPTLTPQDQSDTEKRSSSLSSSPGTVYSSLDCKRPFSADEDDDCSNKKRCANDVRRDVGSTSEAEVEIGEFQEVLLLHAPKQRYIHTKDYQIPSVKDEREMLVKVQAIGLNPIDWKAPDFGFGLPALPCISGRDFAGEIVRKATSKSRFRAGDRVLGIATDYRDSRKSAYQEYSVVADYNACRIPDHIPTTAAAPIGVAYVAAALALGVCLGIDFSKAARGVKGPNMKQIVQSVEPEKWPIDVRDECSNGIPKEERPVAGDWIAIWGGSSATGMIATQLAKLAGLRVICILDMEKNASRLLKHGADVLVDRHDSARAIQIIRGITHKDPTSPSSSRLRYALDTRGKESATLLADLLSSSSSASVDKDSKGDMRQAHLVGLTGLPKEKVEGVTYHNVPIKAFHEAKELGEAMMGWLEGLLEKGALGTPDKVVVEGGLEGVNGALDLLREGKVSGPRIVVTL